MGVLSALAKPLLWLLQSSPLKSDYVLLSLLSQRKTMTLLGISSWYIFLTSVIRKKQQFLPLRGWLTK
jgi:hypothetical protein